MKVKQLKVLVQRTGRMNSLNLMTTRLYPPFNYLWIFESNTTIYIHKKKRMLKIDAKKFVKSIKSSKFWIRVSGEIIVRGNIDQPEPNLPAEIENKPDEIIFELIAKELEFLPL